MNSFKKCRENAGLTQKEVAVELKVSIQAISYWETGERMPSYERLFQLADLYKTTTDKLLGRFTDSNVLSPSALTYSHDEAQLIIFFRQLSEQNKAAIQDYIQFLINKQVEEKETHITTA